jgi:DNA-binding response OmpR family regulator/DNA-binding CsgD family transcriptional regulator
MDRWTIMIVDDDPNQLKILTGHLIEHNPDFNLLIATNGKSGYEIAVSHFPDLILMDWEMPAVSGLEAIRMIKDNEKTSGIPIIMITGIHGEVEKLREALDAGAIDFINKPFSGIELIARIDTQLRHIDIQRKYLLQLDKINKQENEIAEKEKAILVAELDYQKKQLTTGTLNLVKQGQLLQSVTEDINSLLPCTTDEGKKIINSLVSRLNDKSGESIWSEFETCFENVHSDFYPKLIERIPDISVREKRLCAFLKMNMSTKEIASITFQSQNAIDVAKHRLRKKLGVNSDEDFVNFLVSL